MRSARITAAFALLLIIMTGVVAAEDRPAQAAGQGEPILGDLTGDGLTDRATLAILPPDQCAVIVESGLPGGGFDTPRVYPYPEPGGNAIGACPDLGTAIDLGWDGTVELAVGWFAGRPEGVDVDLLVLRNYQPAGGISAMFAPAVIGTADFDGDGHPDIYEWNNQGEGFQTYLNRADGALVPGPVRFCAFTPSYALADFNQNGAMDVLLPYFIRCTGEQGVVVVLDDGRNIHLQQDLTGAVEWLATVVDANGDGIPDVRTVEQDSGLVTIFVNDGRAHFTRAAVANDDVVEVAPRGSTVIDVLANDTGVLPTTTVTIVTSPRYGTARVLPDRRIAYTVGQPPPAETDTFVYELTTLGVNDRATVTVRFAG
ncbi:FG-GAP repeat domain-containing protein [Plantactinospora sp. GCM10030261]|uniref:FG-GAP repeat domain-containing protein n=1 Tax=Plantactinospora sp. GCM10030261 TaxID=3273420 RepID=UPI00361493AA